MRNAGPEEEEKEDVCDEAEYDAAVPVERDRECPEEKGDRLRWQLEGRTEWWTVADMVAAISEVEGSVQRRTVGGRVFFSGGRGGERKRFDVEESLAKIGERSAGCRSREERGEEEEGKEELISVVLAMIGGGGGGDK
jgi:hypothetical protein